MALKRQPQKIGATIEAVLHRLGGEGQFEFVKLMKVWPELVGENIARRTEVSHVKFHTAVIKVSNPMWIQELNLMRQQILERIVERIGADAIRDLRFVRGTISRRHPPASAAPKRGPRKAMALPELKNPELRKAFERLVEAWGRAPR